MEKKFYQVFKIDTNFDSYASNDDYVGAESIEDLVAHFDDIYPSAPYVIHREEWMTDEQWEEETEFGKYKEGDTIYEPYFDDNQKQEILDSLTDIHWPRIKAVPHLYTDIPYEIIDSFGYIE